MARVDRTERLLNVVFCLLGAARPVSRAQIRGNVVGYDPDASDSAFERMFERDKDELRGMGIPIETVTDVHGEVEGYLIRRPASVEELTFSAQELALVALAAASWSEAVLEAPARTALLKIEAVSGDAPVLESVGAVRMSAAEAALLPLLGALREQHMVSFDYRGAHDPQANRRQVDPWGVVSHDGHWYLVGHDRDREDRRTFRLSRIIGSVTVTARELEQPCPPELDLRAIVRTMDPEHPARARVRIAAGHGAGLRQAHAPTAGPFDDLELEISAVSDEVLVSQICGAGTGVLVLDPPAIVSRVRDALTSIATAHGSGS
ncbi:MAG: WYL domain-containing protein [Candidatus Nanopelagicales bacterium]|nr:WYL domain-containing protein [Candidatus Nanopelagicales bacterium]